MSIDLGANSFAGLEDGRPVEGDARLQAFEKELEVRKESRVWHFVLLVALIVGGGALFVFVFSGLPYAKGDELFLWLSEYYQWTWIVGGAAVCLTLGLVVLDVRFWKGQWMYAAVGLVLLNATMYGIAAVLAVKEFYVVPMGYFLLGSPFLLMLLRRTVFQDMDMIAFMWTLHFSLMLQACGVGAVWIAWLVIERKWWNVETKVEFYVRMGCNTTALSDDLINATLSGGLTPEQRVSVDNELVGCTSAFMLWLSPAVLGLWSFVFSMVIFFLARMLSDARKKRNSATAVDSLAQVFIMAVALGLFGMWAAAGIAGAEMNLTNVILSLAFLAMVVIGIVVIAVFGAGAMNEGLKGTPLGALLLKNMGGDWAKAIILLLVTPFFCLYLIVSLFTQCSRRLFNCTKDLEDHEKRQLFTSRANGYLAKVRQWNWTSVFVKSIYLGILFFLLSVGVVRIVTLFLSWLNGELANLSLVVNTFIFIAVGIIMFLNPFIPGVPVYLSGGIILVASARPAMGFWGAVVYVIGICSFLKFTAIVMQQKLIGEQWAGKKVWIRKLVGINSEDIRAIRIILQEPGMTLKKVSVLCGGPDWPVSVLTGILKMPLCSMLYGSIPVILLIAPTVLAGATLLRASEGGIWGSLSTLVLGITVVVQSAAMLIAIHFIAATVMTHREEIEKIPLDQEVLALEKAERKKNRMQVHLIHWKRLDPVNKVLLVLSASCMAGSCYVFQLLSSRCFVPFEVSDTIADKLDGDPLNIVLPLGWIGLIMFAIPCVHLFFFNFYAGYLLKAETRRNPSLAIEGEPNEEDEEDGHQDQEAGPDAGADPHKSDTSNVSLCFKLFCCRTNVKN